MMRFACLAVVVCLSIPMLGCKSTPAPSGDVPQSSGSSAPLTQTVTGLPLEPAAVNAIGYVPNWAVDLDLPDSQSIRTATVLEDLNLLVTVETPINLVSAIDLRTGSVRWRQIIGQPDESLFHAHAVSEKQLLVNSEKRVFVLSTTDGRIEGLTNLGSTVVSDPVVIGDYAIFGGRSGDVFAHDIRAGFAKWAYRMSAAILTGLAQSGSNVFAADTAGGYALLMGNDGTLLWRNRTWGAVTANPTVSVGGIFIASRDRSLYSLNRTTGQDNWVYRVSEPLTASAIPMGQLVFLPVPNDGLHAINTKDGRLRWKSNDPILPIKPVDNQVLFLGKEFLQLRSADDGTVVNTVPSQLLHSVQVGPNDALIAVTVRGKILRMNQQS